MRLTGIVRAKPDTGDAKPPRSVKLVAGGPHVGVTPMAMTSSEGYVELIRTVKLPVIGAPGETLTVRLAGVTGCPFMLPVCKKRVDPCPTTLDVPPWATFIWIAVAGIYVRTL